MATRISRAAVGAALAVLLVLMSGGPSAVAAPRAKGDGVDAVIARYQDRIPELMSRKHIPGLAVALVDGDGVVWQQGFGATDSDGRTPVTVDTIFNDLGIDSGGFIGWRRGRWPGR